MYALDDQKNMDIFGLKSIQRIINYRWAHVKNDFYLYHAAPTILQLLVYLYLHHFSRFFPHHYLAD